MSNQIEFLCSCCGKIMKDDLKNVKIVINFFNRTEILDYVCNPCYSKEIDVNRDTYRNR